MATIIGITGTMGSGKSFVSGKLRDEYGARVYDADKIFKDVVLKEAIPYLCAEFPEWVTNNELDVEKIRNEVLSDPEKWQRYLGIVHPLIRSEFQNIKRLEASREGVAIFDVPLLFETKFETLCDHTIVVAADLETQKRRALARNKMTLAQIDTIIASQMPQEEKKAKADFVISSNDGDDVSVQLKAIMEHIVSVKKSPAL